MIGINFCVRQGKEALADFFFLEIDLFPLLKSLILIYLYEFINKVK
jgi:hypothetical protein